MYWDAYTVCSVISGVLMMALAAAPDTRLRERLGFFAGGAGFAGYGWFVATQTSGTFVFPVWIFLIPVAAVAWGAFLVIGYFYERKPDAVVSTPPVDDRVEQS